MSLNSLADTVVSQFLRKSQNLRIPLGGLQAC
jgi:hypothetical protein